eukprot:4584878-Pleurochrysis_carterae.AAC.1
MEARRIGLQELSEQSDGDEAASMVAREGQVGKGSRAWCGAGLKRHRPFAAQGPGRMGSKTQCDGVVVAECELARCIQRLPDDLDLLST